MKSLIKKEDTLLQYMQETINEGDFIRLIGEWLETMEDERMILLRELIFEVELSEIEVYKDKLYRYGSCLTKKNYLERKIFEQLVLLTWQMEQHQSAGN
ncbi:MAG: hypothetical protein PUF65_05340 [Lachnospiraceae bacterium]|nr:hypothetical protein [Lachnospiraceae bacterium]